MSDMERYRGDTYADRVIVTDRLGSPVNVLGFVFKMTLDTQSEPADGSTQVYQLTGDIVDAANGIVEFAPDDSQADQVGHFYYDIEMTDADGRKRTIKKASYTYKQDITK